MSARIADLARMLGVSNGGAPAVVEADAPVPVMIVDPKNDLPHTPAGFLPGQMEGLDGGTNYSGVIQELLPGSGRQRLVNCTKRGAQGMIALATVHVHVKEYKILNNREITDQRLILWVAWASGKAGGDEVVIDATQGAVFTLPGTISVSIDAELIAATDAGTHSLTVEATVHWGTSVSPRPVIETEPTISFVAPFPGVTGFLRLPPRAQGATLLCDDSSMLANTSLEFYRSDNALARQVYDYRAPDPTRHIDICSGVRFYKVRYLGPNSASFVPEFRLAL